MILAAAIIGASIEMIKLLANVAASNSAKQRQLRADVPCIARIDARIIALRHGKTKGKHEAIRALLVKRKQYARNPASCPDVKNLARAQASGAAADDEVDTTLQKPAAQVQQEAASLDVAEAAADNTPLYLGVAVLAVVLLGGIAYSQQGK